MTLSTYLIVQQIIMGAIISMGAQLIFAHIPEQMKGSRLHNSTRVMGLALSLIPLASFFYFFTGMLEDGPRFATALNLSAYCLTATFMAIAYYILLRVGDSHSLIRNYLIVGLIFPFPVWAGLCYGTEYMCKHILIVSYTFYGILICVHAVTCFHHYYQELDDKEQVPSPQRQIELKLLGRTLYVSLSMLIVSLLSPSFFDYPLWLGGVFIGVTVCGFVLIYISYRKAMASSIKLLMDAETELETEQIEELIEAEETDKVDAGALSESIKSNIERHLKMWLDRKEFLKEDVSIASVAKAAYTNRTYIS